jgi:putative intracellular protease/amidase
MEAVMRTIALYTTETMADWEYAYLTAQIGAAEASRPGRFSLTLAGDGLEPVRSQGGMTMQPTADLADLDDSLSVLVIPGGSRYAEGHERVLALAADLLARGVPVAAICGGTFLLARGDLLAGRRHTSNDPGYLQMSGYPDGDDYVVAPVVTDRGLTTASGVHPVPFTAEVMRLIQLYPEPVTAAWEQLYTTGEAKYFYALREATDAWQNA